MPPKSAGFSSNFELRTFVRPRLTPPLTKGGIKGGFTLVEMLVVMAIIALLLAALLPAFSSVRNQAKVAAANAQFRAIDTGLNSFRAESALGGSLPPSVSDRDPMSSDRGRIADPLRDDASQPIRVAGAHLLVHALLGGDGLGTPGFRDVSQPADGLWWNDTHRRFDGAGRNHGLYAIDTATGQTKYPRYPQGGAGYVDEKLKERAESIQDLFNEGKVVSIPDDVSKNERMFMDPWDHPILYYRANPSALRMVGAPNNRGIYWQEDNGVITGSDSQLSPNSLGLDFGQGTLPGVSGGYSHSLYVSRDVEPTPPELVETIRTDPNYDNSFVRFILDGSVKARPTPVQKDSYLLISAGPDARYGSEDDVLNWTRKTGN